MDDLAAPIVYMAPPEGMTIVGQRETPAEVQLFGAASRMNRIRIEQLKVIIGLSKALLGEQMIMTTGRDISFRYGIRFVASEPQNLRIVLK